MSLINEQNLHRSREKGVYILPIFVRPKNDGTCQFILKLKKLNKKMTYVDFNMEALESVLNHITPGCYLASTDPKDAYYSIPIFPNHEKYLKFVWKRQLYQFLFLSIGLCSGPRKCTKLAKPPVTVLGRECHVIATYIDGLINVGYAYDEYRNSFSASVNLFESLDSPKNHFVFRILYQLCNHNCLINT